MGIKLLLRLGLLAGIGVAAAALSGCRYPNRANTGVEPLGRDHIEALRDTISSRGYCAEYLELEVGESVCECTKLKDSCGYLCLCGERLVGN